MKFKLLLSGFALSLLLSCKSVPDNITLFQDLKNNQTINIEQYYNSEPVIIPNDRLLITISSPVLNQEKVAQFNLPVISYLYPGETGLSSAGALQTYLVEKDSTINFPVIGKIKLAGLTKTEAISLIGNLVTRYAPDIIEPVVNFQILTFRVIVVGEVNRPGGVVISNERASILDVIGTAGGLTLYADRKNIKIIRENGGQSEFAILDLTKSDIFTSPYFYVRQNDFIVVEPNKTHIKDSGYGADTNYKMSVISMIIGVVSLIASTVVTIVAINK
ncbi:MAG: polysaccharide biosynthesis/export family protein [Dysgonamonadaceae bacterium]|nr:polysaccharide biosynthesis/export family protein [Dysgonamonadaceae bacterium]